MSSYKSIITVEMRLAPDPFEMIKGGKKHYELRLYDEKRRLIKAGDVIRFTQTESGEAIECTVAAVFV